MCGTVNHEGGESSYHRQRCGWCSARCAVDQLLCCLSGMAAVQVGKSCIALRFAKGDFRASGTSATIGAHFLEKRLELPGMCCSFLTFLHALTVDATQPKKARPKRLCILSSGILRVQSNFGVLFPCTTVVLRRQYWCTISPVKSTSYLFFLKNGVCDVCIRV